MTQTLDARRARLRDDLTRHRVGLLLGVGASALMTLSHQGLAPQLCADEPSGRAALGRQPQPDVAEVAITFSDEVGQQRHLSRDDPIGPLLETPQVPEV